MLACNVLSSLETRLQETGLEAVYCRGCLFDQGIAHRGISTFGALCDPEQLGKGIW